MNLGKAINYCRIKREMTLADLATTADVNKSYLSLLENGKRNPNMSTVEKIAKGLGISSFLLVSLAEILDGEDTVGLETAEKLAKEINRVLTRSDKLC